MPLLADSIELVGKIAMPIIRNRTINLGIKYLVTFNTFI